MSEKRFTLVEHQGGSLSTMFTIYVDNKTGVNYLFVKNGYGAGLTPLLDENGKPVISKLEDK